MQPPLADHPFRCGGADLPLHYANLGLTVTIGGPHFYIVSCLFLTHIEASVPTRSFVRVDLLPNPDGVHPLVQLVVFPFIGSTLSSTTWVDHLIVVTGQGDGRGLLAATQVTHVDLWDVDPEVKVGVGVVCLFKPPWVCTQWCLPLVEYGSTTWSHPHPCLDECWPEDNPI